MNKGTFVVFEGMECTGKTSTIGKVRRLRPDWVYVAELPETEVMKSLLCEKEYNLTPEAELLLFTARRAEQINKIVMPAIKQGKTVVCDRFIYSTLVYQGTCGKFNRSDILVAHSLFCMNMMPDITILLDAPIDVSIQRLESRGYKDRIESNGREFFEKVRDGFLNLFKNNVDSIIISTAECDIDTAAKTAIDFIERKQENV